MFKEPVWDDLNFVTQWSEDVYTVAIKGWTWSASYLGSWPLSYAQFMSKVCQENIP